MTRPARPALRPAIACLAVVVLLAACTGGKVRRVSEPAAGIQQLAVAADGSWTVELRIDNYSSIPMRFERVDFAVTVGGTAAGRLAGTPALPVGPESADVATLRMTPTPEARLRMADALASGRGIDYTLDGRVDATPEGAGSRSFDLDRRSALSPVPGLPGVLR
ncbi:LEA/WHy family protein [Luteimonas pelagia]